MTRERWAPREQKSQKIEGLIAGFLRGRPLNEMACLDLGCGSGEITLRLAQHFRRIVGVEYDGDRALAARRRVPAEIGLLQADAEHLPFADGFFDVVVCAQVYEHMSSVRYLAPEVERVLRPRGICFFSGPNKLWPVEPHYLLPFVHWLPQSLADRYMQLAGKGDRFDIRPLTLRRLRHLWRRFEWYDCTETLLTQPDCYGDSVPRLRLPRPLILALLRAGYALVPNFNWILVKPDG